MRSALRPVRVSAGTHAGLALHRLTPAHAPRDPGHAAHIDAIAALAAPPAYESAYLDWCSTAAELAAVRGEFVVERALAIGTGGPSPLEVGLTLHHTYGVPFLPGSALKGLAAQAAREVELAAPDVRVIFGAGHGHPGASAGYVTFWDGWLIPQPNIPPLRRDVMTIHHAAYYSSHGGKPPTDFDDPRPVNYLSVGPGCRFLVAVSCPESAEAATTAFELINWGMEHLGLGGKTNSGYGRLKRASP